MATPTTKQKHTFLKTFPVNVFKPLLKEVQKVGGILKIGNLILKEEELEEALKILDEIQKDYKDWINTGAPKVVHQNLKNAENLFP
ncbi:hypothetical protein [Xanthocytophaga flava]|uniref:hypothetical protein n=1 Tax=Xanthocytophaga flava TaxID=3048013 RepID=UPI0028D56462|nr:hypothetical protein [Xanthocytophaga flavus]MDJ1468189.1 hypothetical protein [Xanthocytophaga flavus]